MNEFPLSTFQARNQLACRLGTEMIHKSGEIYIYDGYGSVAREGYEPSKFKLFRNELAEWRIK